MNQIVKILRPDAETIKNAIFASVAGLLDDASVTVTSETALVGNKSLLDSVKLVELCLDLEDQASELGFEFDWTSDAAMSKSRSMFRTAGMLVAEFLRQREAQA